MGWGCKYASYWEKGFYQWDRNIFKSKWWLLHNSGSYVCIYTFIKLAFCKHKKRSEKLWNTGWRNVTTKTLLPEQLMGLLDIVNYSWVLTYTKTSISGTPCCLFVWFIFKSFEHWDGLSHCSHLQHMPSRTAEYKKDICFLISEDMFGLFPVVKSIRIGK